MANTTPNILIDKKVWVDLNTLSGIPAGTTLVITNVGGTVVSLATGSIAPFIAGIMEGIPLLPYIQAKATGDRQFAYSVSGTALNVGVFE